MARERAGLVVGCGNVWIQNFWYQEKAINQRIDQRHLSKVRQEKQKKRLNQRGRVRLVL